MKKTKNRVSLKQRFFNIVGLVTVTVFLFLLPTQFGKHFFFSFSYINGVRVDYLAPTLYLTNILAVLVIFLFAPRLKRAPFLFVFLTLLLLCVGSFFSFVPLLSLGWVIQTGIWLFLFYIFRSLYVSFSSLVRIFIPILALFQFVLAGVQFLEKHSIQGFMYFFGERLITVTQPGAAVVSLNGNLFLRPYGTFSHPNSMAGFFLLLFVFISESSLFKKQTLLTSISLFFCAGIVFLSFSKIAIIMLGIYIMFKAFRSGCKLCIFARFLAIGTLAYISLSSQTDPLSLVKRVSLFDQGLTMAQSFFLFGTGRGVSLIAQASFPSVASGFFLQPVHNIFLLAFVEYGIIQLGAIIYLSFSWIKHALRSPVLYWLLLSITFTGFFDHYWLTLQQNILLSAVLLGLGEGEKI